MIQSGKENELSPDQRVSFSKLLTNCSQITQTEKNINGENNSLAERGLKRLKTKASGTSAYMDTRFIFTTSNLCERLFSIAGYALNDRRMSVFPVHFEEQMFVFCNFRLWSISDINDMVTSKED